MYVRLNVNAHIYAHAWKLRYIYQHIHVTKSIPHNDTHTPRSCLWRDTLVFYTYIPVIWLHWSLTQNNILHNFDPRPEGEGSKASPCLPSCQNRQTGSTFWNAGLVNMLFIALRFRPGGMPGKPPGAAPAHTNASIPCAAQLLFWQMHASPLLWDIKPDNGMCLRGIPYQPGVFWRTRMIRGDKRKKSKGHIWLKVRKKWYVMLRNCVSIKQTEQEEKTSSLPASWSAPPRRRRLGAMGCGRDKTSRHFQYILWIHGILDLPASMVKQIPQDTSQ